MKKAITTMTWTASGLTGIWLSFLISRHAYRAIESDWDLFYSILIFCAVFAPVQFILGGLATALMTILLSLFPCGNATPTPPR